MIRGGIYLPFVLALFFAESMIGFRSAAAPDYRAEALASDLSIGSMSESDFNRFDKIGTIIERRHIISDQDLSWCIKLLKNGPVKKSDQAQARLASSILFELLLLHRRDLTVHQLNQMDHFGVWLSHSNFWANRLWSINLFVDMHDEAAIPIIENLCSDPNSLVAQNAGRVMAEYNSRSK